MLIDYHVHTDYSVDARGSIADYCQRALEAGVGEICFTPHHDNDSQRPDKLVRVRGQLVPVTSDWLERFLEDIEDARQRFPSLYIGAGLELDYSPEREDELGKILSSHSFDFAIGSVHCLNHLALSERADSHVYFTGRTAREVCTSYFRVVRLMVQSGLFDAVGHLDVFKRFGRQFYGSSLTQAVYGLPERVFEEMAKGNIALEVNASGWRHACREPYPSLDLLGLAYDCGIQRVTLGSDAHRPTQLGDGIRKAAMVAQEAGFSQFFTYRERKPTPRPFAILKTSSR